MPRNIWEEPWNGHPIRGLLFFLSNWSNCKWSMKELEYVIGQGRRLIKNKFKDIFLSKYASQFIVKTGKKNVYFQINQKYANTPLNELFELFQIAYYKFKYGPNKPESIIHDVLKNIDPENWDLTCDRIPKHRIGKYYPDLTHIKKNAVVEHNGDWAHSEYFTGKKKHIHHRDRIEKFFKHEIFCLIIWEHELENMYKVEKKIIMFIDYINTHNIKEVTFEKFLEMSFSKYIEE